MEEMTLERSAQGVLNPARSPAEERRSKLPLSRNVILSLSVFVLSFALLFLGPALALRLIAGPQESALPGGGVVPVHGAFGSTAYTVTTFQQGKYPTTAYTGTQDTYINRWIPDTNFGNEARLVMGQSWAYRPLIRFDLTPGAIPPTANVVSATLGIQCYARNIFNSMTAEIYQVKRPWNKLTSTWYEASTGVPWGEEGCSSPVTDRFYPAALTTTVFLREMQQFDVTSIVQNWVSGPGSNQGFELVGPDPAVIYYYRSSRYGTVAERPRLIITWTMDALTPTPTPTPTGPTPTPTATPPYVPVILDNTSACYTHTPGVGFWQPGTPGTEGYGGNYWYEASTLLTGTARWAPCIAQPIPADGMYEVWAHWSAHPSRPIAVPYTIKYDGGIVTATVDQTKTAAGTSPGTFTASDWLSLGVYPFKAGTYTTTGQYVEINSSGPGSDHVPGTGDTCADAVKFTPAPGMPGPPVTLRMTAIPNTLPSDGAATSTILITVTDQFGHAVADGTMVGITTSLGSIPYTYTEAEWGDVTKLGTWSDDLSAEASGGVAKYSDNFGDEVTWTFYGTAVSMIYKTDPGGGVADVSVDGVYATTISYYNSVAQYRLERLIRSNLAPGVPHTVRVTGGGVGRVWVDAFRSGVMTSGGVAMATLTAPDTIGTATLRAVALQPGVVRASVSLPFTVTTLAFPGPSEVWVDDDYCSACSNGGHLWNYDAFKTIQAGVTKVLTGGAVYVGPGTYTESVTVTKSLSLEGAGSNASILNGVNDSPAKNGFYVDRAEDVTITGFKIKDFGVGIYLHGISNAVGDRIANATITQNKFESNGTASSTYALRGSFVHSSTLCSNEVTLGYNGFLLEGAYSTVVCYNHMHDNLGFGVKVDVGNDNSIDNNTIHDQQNVGIELAGATLNNGVYNNVLHDLWWDGILVNGDGLSTASIGSNVITRTNLVWLNASGSAPDANHNLGGVVLTGTTSSEILDNRILEVSNAEGNRSNASGVYLRNNVAPITIARNWIEDCVGHGIYYPTAGGTPTIHGNSIFGNGRYGLNNTGVDVLSVEGNWWGRNVPTSGGPEPQDIFSSATVTSSPPISLTLAAAPTVIDANGEATATITATASGGGYNILDGTYITLTSDLNTLVYPGSTVFGSGRATAILRAGTLAGVATITGTAEPGQEGQTVTVTIRALGPWSVSILAEPPSVAIGGNQSIVTATVRDVHSNPVPGQAITFSSNALGGVSPALGTTSAAGQVSTTFTSGGILGTGRVTATASITLSAAVNIPVTAGPVCTGSMTLDAAPPALLANGVATSTLSVQMSDCLGNPVVNGTMVGFTTTLGTIVDLQYVEAESASVITSTGWVSNTGGGETYIETSTSGAAAFWNFRGTAVSLRYRQGTVGVMRVRVDGGTPVDIDTNAPTAWLERVIANNLDPNVGHQIEVTHQSGTFQIDAFRSGVTTSAGRATAVLRAPVLAITDTGTVWATERIGHPNWPTLVVTRNVVFSQTNVVWVDDDYCPSCPNGGHAWGNDAFSNIPDGVTAVRSPGTVFVAAGTYTLPVNITKTLNLLGAGAAETFIEGYGLLTPAITVTNSSNVVIRNFTVQNWATGVNISGGPSIGLEVSNNVFTDCATIAVSGVFLDYSTFANNVIQHSDGHGIELDTISHVTLRENQIRDISGTGIHIFSSLFTPCISNQVSYNTIERLGADGIQVGQACSNTLVLSNTVRSTNRTAVGGGIVLSSTTDSTVNYNLVVEVSNAGGSSDTAGIRIDGANDHGEIHFNRVLSNRNDGVACLSYNTPPTVTCNHIYGNGNYGLVNNFGTVVDARNNWWGHSTPSVGPPAPADIGMIAPLNVNWTPAITMTVTPAAAAVAVGSAPIAITVTACGGSCCMLDGMPVTITTSLGTFGVPATTTLQGAFAGGSAIFWFDPGTVAGTAYITVTTPYTEMVTTNVAINAGPPAAIDLVVSDPTIEVGIGPGSQTDLKAYVRDLYGNWVADGISITFATDLGVITPTIKTTTGGLAQTTFYAGTLPGVATVRASWGFVIDTAQIQISSGPPFAMFSLTADPAEILANGLATSTITAVVHDAYANPVPDGTMVGFLTNLGSVIYGLAEAETPAVIKSGFGFVPGGGASGTGYIEGVLNDSARWGFQGAAVALGYRVFSGGGVMRVVVDGVPVQDIDTNVVVSAWVEVAMPGNLDPAVPHTVEVNVVAGTVRLDYLRSGARTVSGAARATLTSAFVSGTATVTAYAIGGAFPWATVNVEFLDPLEVWVDDNFTPLSTGGHLWGFDAFSNIPAGVTRVRTGGTVHVADGVYTMPVTITRPVYLDGAGSSATTYLHGADTGDGIFVAETADGTVIEGFKIDHFQHGLHLAGLSSDRLVGITVTNMAIELCANMGGGAITATWLDNSYFGDNNIHNLNGYGFDLNVGDNNRIVGNHIHDNSRWGIRIFGELWSSFNNLISLNTLYDLNWNGIHIGQGSVDTRVLTNTLRNTNLTDATPEFSQNLGAIGVYQADGTRIEGNTISYVQNGGGALFDTAGIGLDCAAPGCNTGTVILNNMIRNNLDNGIWISNDGFPVGSPPQIHGNSIYSHGRYGFASNHGTATAEGLGNWWGRNTPTVGFGAPYDISNLVGVNINFTPTIQLTLDRFPTQIVADGASTAEITVTMQCTTCLPIYNVLNGTVVSLTTSLGSLGAPLITRPMANGQNTAILQAGTVAGRAWITGTTPSNGIADNWVDLIAGPAASISFTNTPTAIWVFSCSSGQPGSTSIVATALDAFGNPCAGHAVTFSVSSGLGTANVAPPTATLNASGRATTTLTSGDVAGTILVTATVDSLSQSLPVVIMSGQPALVAVDRWPVAIPADGTSVSAIIANVKDGPACDNPIYDGTMVGFETSLGSLPYRYVEAEAAEVTKAGPGWLTVGDANASGSSMLETNHPGDWVSWQFRGQAVSLIYNLTPAGGSARVTVDGAFTKTIGMSGVVSYQVETVIANTLDPLALHTVKVECVSGWTYADALRSGSTTVGGQATAPLTAGVITGTAYVTATAVDSRSAVQPLSLTQRPTGTTTVVFGETNLAITKTASITEVPSGGIVVFTLFYTNTGSAAATNTLITDTLPVSFTYESSVSSPNLGVPTNPITNVWVWNAGTVVTGTSGYVSITARRTCVPGLGTFTNTVSIGSLTLDSDATNNSGSVPLTFTPSAPVTITLSSVPQWVQTNNSSTIFITVTDGCGVPVPGYTVFLTLSNRGSFSPTGTLAYTMAGPTGPSGATSTTFYGGVFCGVATITGTAGLAQSAPLYVPIVAGTAVKNNVWADPNQIPADGMSTSTITARIEDAGDCPMPDGYFVGFETTAGTMLHRLADDPGLTAGQQGSGWSTLSDPLTYGGSFMQTAVAGASLIWDFYGNGVSVMYLKNATGGLADVYVDNAWRGVINMNCITGTLYQAESVYTWPGSPTEHHWLRVARQGPTGPIMNIDAVRSGAATQGGDGKATSLLTSDTTPGVATVTATGILPDASGGIPARLISTANVSFTISDLVVSKSVQPAAQVVIGQKITYTLQVRNTGSVTATNVLLDDVLDVDALRNTFFSTTPVTMTPYTHYRWPIGIVSPGQILTITFGGTVDTSRSWPSATVLTNIVTGTTTTLDTDLLNNVSAVSITVVTLPPASLSLAAVPSTIPVGGSISTLTARARDIYGNPVPNGTPVTFTTTLGGFPVLSQFVGSTSSGDAVAALQSGCTLGTASITAVANSLSASTGVQFVPRPPFTMTITANPSVIFVGGETALIEAVIVDNCGNWVADGTLVTFATSHGTILPPATTTFNGRAFATLTSGTVAVTATVTVSAAPASGTLPVRFRAGTPIVSMSARPMEPRVGNTSIITLTARDIFFNPVSFEPVTFTTTMGDFGGYTTTYTTSDASGRAAATLRSETIGPALVRGVIRGVPGEIVINWQPGDPYTITVTVDPKIIPDCVGTAGVRALVRDRYLNPVRDGTVVVFRVSPQGEVRPVEGGRTVDGVATAVLSAGGVPGPATVMAWPEQWQGSVNGRDYVTFVVGPPDVLALTADPPDLLVGGQRSTLRLHVLDCGGYPVTDTTAVTFTITAGEGIVSPPTTNTTNGWAYATLTSPAETGAATIRAQAGNREAAIIVHYRPGPPCDIRLTAVPAAIAADGVSTCTVCAEIQDCWGNYVADRTNVSFTTSRGRFETGSSFSTFTVAGRACAILMSSTTFGPAVVASQSGDVRAERVVDFYFSPTPTPSPTPVPAARTYLPIIRKKSR